MHWYFGRRTSTQNNYHYSWYFNVDFDNNEILFFFFLYLRKVASM